MLIRIKVSFLDVIMKCLHIEAGAVSTLWALDKYNRPTNQVGAKAAYVVTLDRLCDAHCK